jgi:serine/tyrosine/threonine adenylyltransferase
MTMRFGFTHSYAELPAHYSSPVAPTPVAAPVLIAFNGPLAAELGLNAESVEAQATELLSGNRLPEDARPIAMAYAGHQFGVFVPSLGDGRAILLGELRDHSGSVRDLQLKGAGRTPFSRAGDGRGALGPMLREYLLSEAMHALGVPTTRSLAVVATGENVYRRAALPGAVLSRVAASHLRVGTFQYFAARGDHAAVQRLLQHVIERHYPEAARARLPALAVLEQVIQRQLQLIVRWMLVGFIHGVMNTDNMAISGETIDYGPCAFMDDYDPATVFSSIDHAGRYAYANQPVIAQWNLARLAETLLPLIDPDSDRAIGLAKQLLDPFVARFDAQFLAGIRAKIGLASAIDTDSALIRELFGAMQSARADFTLTFRMLTRLAEHPDDVALSERLFGRDSVMHRWLQDWRARLAVDPQSLPERVAAMRAVNPLFIPRNHRVQAALDAAEAGDLEPFRTLLAILQRPYDEQAGAEAYAQPPQSSERVLQTFCGT